MVNGLQRVYVCSKRASDGGYNTVALNIYPYAAGQVVGELPSGDVVVGFEEWEANQFVFKKDELIYGN